MLVLPAGHLLGTLGLQSLGYGAGLWEKAKLQNGHQSHGGNQLVFLVWQEICLCMARLQGYSKEHSRNYLLVLCASVALRY